MKIGYLDCSMGISGDMTVAALIDAGVDVEAMQQGIASLGIPGVELHVDDVMKGGFHAKKIRIDHPPQHAHRGLGDILDLLAKSTLTHSQQEIAVRIFRAVAEAEACVHGSTIEKVHFHEVGAIDSIVDIVSTAIGFDELGLDQLVASRIPTGRGQIRIDHGVCTVPAPGTAELLKGIPLVEVPVDAELTTPTGAAILVALVDRYQHGLPEMTIDQIGYGAGTRDFPDRANLLRLFVGHPASAGESDFVTVLETNLDDVSPEVIGFTKQKLLESGALDVYSSAIQMKKDRPGVLLSLICRPADADRLQELVFDETGTFGIRRLTVERSTRSRRGHSVTTEWGEIEGKLGWRNGIRPVFTPEFESCAKSAETHRVPLRDIYRAAEAAFDVESRPATDHGGHSHDHDHDHDHDHSHDHDHDHDHGHDHG